MRMDIHASHLVPTGTVGVGRDSVPACVGESLVLYVLVGVLPGCLISALQMESLGFFVGLCLWESRESHRVSVVHSRHGVAIV